MLDDTSETERTADEWAHIYRAICAWGARKLGATLTAAQTVTRADTDAGTVILEIRTDPKHVPNIQAQISQYLSDLDELADWERLARTSVTK